MRGQMLFPMLAIAAMSMMLLPATDASAANDDADKPHVVFVVGEGEYRSEITMPALAERLASTWGWRTTVLLDQSLHSGDDNHVPGLDALDDADLLVLYLRFRRWPADDLEALGKYIDSGRPIVAFRTTTHAFNYPRDDPRADWNNFGADVLGAPWIRHYGHASSTHATTVVDSAKDTRDGETDNTDPSDDCFAVLGGVPESFDVRSWTYHIRPDHPPADATILVYGSPVREGIRSDDPATVNPIVWTRSTKRGGRVFMTTMGHPEDFHVEAFRRLIGNGLHWALGKPTPNETLPDFPKVLHPDDQTAAPDDTHKEC